MLKKISAVLLLAFVCVSTGVAKEIEGVQLPETATFGGEELVLNGGGVRIKLHMDQYVGGLYLKQKSQDATRIIEADEPMAICLHIISSMVTSERMAKSTEEGFEASTGGKTAPIRDKIDSYIALFKEGIQKGDSYDLVYLPGKGVQAYKNSKLVSSIPGLDFKKALFGIWLCEKPTINTSLKEGMLGR
jgi:Chalcone isomerase-like